MPCWYAVIRWCNRAISTWPDLRLGAARVELPVPAAVAPVEVSLEAALHALYEQNLPNLYEHIEETIFRSAYRFCHGNQLQTGRLLNISRNIVRARLEAIGELNPSGRLLR